MLFQGMLSGSSLMEALMMLLGVKILSEEYFDQPV